MLFRRKSPEKPFTEMNEEELDRVLAECQEKTQHITAKREKERSRTTLGFATGFKALGLIGGTALLTMLTGSFLVGFVVAVGVTGGLIYRGVKKELDTEETLDMRRMVAGKASGYFKHMRADPVFKAQVLDSIADDFKTGAQKPVTVSKPLTLQRRKPGLFH